MVIDSLVERNEGVYVARVVADNKLGTAKFCQALVELSEQGSGRGFVFNLAGVNIIPSELLGALVVLHRSAPNSVKLCHVNPNVFETLTRTQLLRLFEVFEDEGSALASLQHAAPSI